MKPPLSLSILLLAGSLAYAGHPKLARDLDTADPNSTVNVIVQFKDAPTEQNQQRMRTRGARHRTRLASVNGGMYTVSVRDLEALANDPDVEFISPDREVSGNLDNTIGSINFWPGITSWYDTNHRAKAQGISIAFLDSGVNAAHANFKAYQTTTSRVVYSQSFVGGNTSDQYGHGTHVAGIGSGADNISDQNSNSIRNFWGTAADSSIVNLKVLDANGRGTDSAVIAGIDRAIQLKSTYNIRVMNLSLGRPVTESYKTDPLCKAVERAWKAGIVVVVAAGNEGRNNSVQNKGYGTITSPGNDPYVITVGAVNDKQNGWRGDDVIATYSSKGPTQIDHIVKPDLVAPGNRIVSYQAAGSTLVSQFPANRPPLSAYMSNNGAAPSPDFFTMSGTSMATPFVAGAIAALLGHRPEATIDQIRATLYNSVHESASYRNASHGRLNLGSAVAEITRSLP